MKRKLEELNLLDDFLFGALGSLQPTQECYYYHNTAL